MGQVSDNVNKKEEMNARETVESRTDFSWEFLILGFWNREKKIKN